MRTQAMISASGDITVNLGGLRTLRIGSTGRLWRQIYSKEELLIALLATEYLENLRRALRCSAEPVHRLDCVVELSEHETSDSTRELHIHVQAETTTTVAVVTSQAEFALTGASLLDAVCRAGLYRTRVTAKCYTALDRTP
jgi:hypothetical protein